MRQSESARIGRMKHPTVKKWRRRLTRIAVDVLRAVISRAANTLSKYLHRFVRVPRSLARLRVSSRGYSHSFKLDSGISSGKSGRELCWSLSVATVVCRFTLLLPHTLTAMLDATKEQCPTIL